MRRVWSRLLTDERGGLFGLAVTPAGWVVILAVVGLTALGTVAAGYAFQKKTQSVGGMTFQQVIQDTPTPATPKPADSGGSSAPSDNSSQPAVVQQPVDQPPIVVVTNGSGTDDGSTTHNGSSSSSSSGSSSSGSGGSSGCPDRPLIGSVHPDSGPMNCP